MRKACLIASLTRFNAAPVSTCTRHGWMFEPLGAKRAIATISRSTSRGTASGLYARIERRVRAASKTSAAGVLMSILFPGNQPRHPKLAHRCRAGPRGDDDGEGKSGEHHHDQFRSEEIREDAGDERPDRDERREDWQKARDAASQMRRRAHLQR